MTNKYYPAGTMPVLKSSTMVVAPSPGDSLKKVLALWWTNPKYATDSSSEKYVIQIDSSGRNFAKAVNFTVSGALRDSFSAKQLNEVLLGYGFKVGVTYAMDIRVMSSYANNNEQLTSNTLTLQMTPYKIPPKVNPVPGTLFIVGDALSITPGTGWSNPVDTPYQQLTKIDSVTYGGIFNITGGKSYLFLPNNGDWNHKYAVVDNTVSGLSSGGNFGYYSKDTATMYTKNFPAPVTSGWYLIVVNFQTGLFSVAPYQGPTVPRAITPSPGTLSTGLWIIGDATPELPSWKNDSLSLANQQFKEVTNSDYQLTLPLKSIGSYLFLPAAGDWNNKYGGASATGGSILFDSGVPGSNTPAPAVAGNYTIDVNFVTGKYTVTKQ